eukprot:855779-Rhodomonas_salina.5
MSVPCTCYLSTAQYRAYATSVRFSTVHTLAVSGRLSTVHTPSQYGSGPCIGYLSRGDVTSHRR